MGATASTSNFEEYLPNSSIQNCFTTGSVRLFTTFLRYSLSDNIRMTPNSVLSGCSRSAKMALRRTYSSRGPHESAQIFLKIQIGGVEIHRVVDAVLRHVVQDAFGEFPVRIHHRDAVARHDIGDHHVAQKRGLARAGLTHDVHVVAPVGRLDAEHPAGIPEIRCGKGNDHGLETRI